MMRNIRAQSLLMMALLICCATSFRDQQYTLHGHNNARCVDIPQNLSLCHNIGYTRMRLPNLLEQETLDEVSQQSAFWLPLLASRCNSNTRLFLCSLFSPVCLDQPVFPCRSLCESVRDDCEPRMARFGFPWPGMFACSQFPVDNQLCIGQINLEESDENIKGTGENIDDIAKGGSFGFDHDAMKHGKPNFQLKQEKKSHNKNKSRDKQTNSGRESSKKNGTKEALKKDEIVKTLELICKADFAAKIKPTGIFSMDGLKESRITSKKVVFYKADEAVLRTAKSHPSDFGPTHRHRYYFYTDDALLVKLSQKIFHPSFKEESFDAHNGENNTGLVSLLKSSSRLSGEMESNSMYKIHKNDQLLVAGNKTSANGKNNRLSLVLMMRIDDEIPFVKRIIKMFKESSDFCREAEAMKDPLTGEKKLKGYLSGGRRHNDKQDKGSKRHKKNQHKEKNKKKDKLALEEHPDRRGKGKKMDGKTKPQAEPATTKRTRKASGARNQRS